MGDISNSLPMWDSFEASFFMLAGLSIGFVLGILFPSLLRTLRRGLFGKFQRDSMETLIVQDLKSYPFLSSTADSQECLPLSALSFFLQARYFFQMGNYRQSIPLYLKILTSENVSQKETHQALYELSLAYEAMGLLERSYDVGIELLGQKKNHVLVFRHLLLVVKKLQALDKLNHLMKLYKGPTDVDLCKKISSVYCTIAQHSKEFSVEWARKAVKWDRSSGRALAVLWQVSSRDFWKDGVIEPKIMWVALASLLESCSQVHQAVQVSPVAMSSYLGEIICICLSNERFLLSFHDIQKEFWSIWKLDFLNEEVEKKIFESIFYAVLLLDKSHRGEQLMEFLHLLNFPLVYFESLEIKESFQKGFLFHRCQHCQSVVDHFDWTCQTCGKEETLFPCLSPITKSSTIHEV